MVLLPDFFQRGETYPVGARLPVGKVTRLLTNAHLRYDFLNTNVFIHMKFDGKIPSSPSFGSTLKCV